VIGDRLLSHGWRSPESQTLALSRRVRAPGWALQQGRAGGSLS
jgi:hypothetical protein